MDILSSSITIAFCILIGFATRNGIKTKKYIAYSNTASTWGVLGTFVGIIIGLLKFDVNNIQESIPILLGGLQTAFITSICGMGSALYLRHLNCKEQKDNTSEDPLIQGNNDIIKLLTQISYGISGNANEGSLLNQITLMRTRLVDYLEEINKSFKAFVETQADSNSQAIMEALDKVLSEFTVAINEHLTQSFQDFRISCENLHDWQQAHISEVEAIHTMLNRATGVIQRNASLLEHITENQNILLKTTNGLNANLEELRAHSDQLRELKTQWPTVIRDVQANVSKMATQIHEAALESSNTMSKASETVSTTAQEIVSGASDRIQSQLQQIDTSLRAEYENLLKGLFEPIAAITTHLVNNYDHLNRIIETIEPKDKQ